MTEPTPDELEAGGLYGMAARQLLALARLTFPMMSREHALEEAAGVGRALLQIAEIEGGRLHVR